MEIIICEDNAYQRKDLESLINTEIENLDFKIALSTNNPNAVIKYVENNSSNNMVYFLDIDFYLSLLQR